MESIENFKEILKARTGMFFKFYDGNIVRIGRHEKYLIEGIGILKESIKTQSISGNQNLEILIVEINPQYIEGTVMFDAMASNLDGETNKKIAFFLKSDTNQENFELIKKHEINHLRTMELAEDKEGELNNFYSEILADLLLISEFESDNSKKLKILDVHKLLNCKIPDYYNRYLKIIERILNTDNSKEIAKIILTQALDKNLKSNSIYEIELAIDELIKN